MKPMLLLSGVFCSILLALTLPGCQKEGPAERTGRALDEAAQDAAMHLDRQRQKAEELRLDSETFQRDCAATEGGC